MYSTSYFFLFFLFFSIYFFFFTIFNVLSLYIKFLNTHAPLTAVTSYQLGISKGPVHQTFSFNWENKLNVAATAAVRFLSHFNIYNHRIPILTTPRVISFFLYKYFLPLLLLQTFFFILLLYPLSPPKRIFHFAQWSLWRYIQVSTYTSYTVAIRLAKSDIIHFRFVYI